METPEKVGPVGQQVAGNLKGLRTRAGMSVRELSAKLKELGRPILPSGITKIEHAERRVDADDLIALAIALDVSPIFLLAHSEQATEKLQEYQETDALTPITDAVFDAVVRDRVDPIWVQYQLEQAIHILPALEEVLIVKKRGGDRGEHQEET